MREGFSVIACRNRHLRMSSATTTSPIFNSTNAPHHCHSPPLITPLPSLSSAPLRKTPVHPTPNQPPPPPQTTAMPTPESALFLSKKPTVPPSFDGVDYDDTPRLKQAQDAVIREQWVRSMMARLVREELGRCYYREGVNHLERCGVLRGMFSFLFGEIVRVGEREAGGGEDWGDRGGGGERRGRGGAWGIWMRGLTCGWGTCRAVFRAFEGVEG